MRYFIRYIKNGIETGIDVMDSELAQFIMQFIRAGYIVTGVELYK